MSLRRGGAGSAGLGALQLRLWKRQSSLWHLALQYDAALQTLHLRGMGQAALQLAQGSPAGALVSPSAIPVPRLLAGTLEHPAS
mmetsp:Transcript_28525/g.78314  ORF Transcript_28525/g.78314 Transcript_28525/m.78314 type:complete len:84 (-) Transcript_28525:2-253(-)